MTRGVVIVGASGLAREVLAAGLGDAVGIVDDDASLHGTALGGLPVLGGIDGAVARGERLLVCIGPGAARRRVVGRLRAAGVSEDRYAGFVAETARVGSTSSVGRGSILLDGVVVTAGVSVGRHVVAMPNCVVTHDDVLGDFVTLAAGVALGGGVRVGEAAYLGMHASVRQGLVVGAGATVGMGAVVLSDVPSGETWAGVPARRMGARP